MTSIDTLIRDIYSLVEAKDGRFTEALGRDLSDNIQMRLRDQLGERQSGSRSSLRMSRLGPTCPRALWYSVHRPELAEPPPPWAEIKFSYGHILESFCLVLAKGAGHKVEGEQDELELDGIKGHRDCVIDGCVVDVKSLSSRGFLKLKQKTIAEDDPFGYLDQLDAYCVASRDDPLVVIKDRAYIFGIDKTLGHMILYEHKIREDSIRARIREYKRICAEATTPACTCVTESDGKSGNIKLSTRAAYSAFKFCCFPTLRTFLYASGPVYLSRVLRKPDVPEIDRHGNFIQ